jgi:hypothetical protein
MSFSIKNRNGATLRCPISKQAHIHLFTKESIIFSVVLLTIVQNRLCRRSNVCSVNVLGLYRINLRYRVLCPRQFKRSGLVELPGSSKRPCLIPEQQYFLHIVKILKIM